MSEVINSTEVVKAKVGHAPYSKTWLDDGTGLIKEEHLDIPVDKLNTDSLYESHDFSSEVLKATDSNEVITKTSPADGTIFSLLGLITVRLRGHDDRSRTDVIFQALGFDVGVITIKEPMAVEQAEIVFNALDMLKMEAGIREVNGKCELFIKACCRDYRKKFKWHCTQASWDIKKLSGK